MCHCSRRPNNSSVPSSKVWTSLGKSRPRAKHCAIRPLSPFSHTRTHAEDGGGLPSSMNEGCHAGEVWDKDATFWAAGVGSRIVIPLDCRGGVLANTSPEPGWACSFVRGLLRCRFGGGEGGGDWTWAGGGSCCSGVYVPGTKRLIDITLLVTISDSAPDEWTDSAAAILPMLEPRVLLGEDFLVRPVDALVLGDDETHVQQTRPWWVQVRPSKYNGGRDHVLLLLSILEEGNLHAVHQYTKERGCQLAKLAQMLAK